MRATLCGRVYKELVEDILYLHNLEARLFTRVGNNLVSYPIPISFQPPISGRFDTVGGVIFMMFGMRLLLEDHQTISTHVNSPDLETISWPCLGCRDDFILVQVPSLLMDRLQVARRIP